MGRGAYAHALYGDQRGMFAHARDSKPTGSAHARNIRRLNVCKGLSDVFKLSRSHEAVGWHLVTGKHLPN